MSDRDAPGPRRSASSSALGAGAGTALALALDLADLGAARALARRLAPWFAVAKVGLELFSAAGPEAIRALDEDGFAVFVDLKLHDIPTTVARAARVLGRLGPRYVTLHAQGGRAMLEAGAAGLAEGAAAAGAGPCTALAVTVLTSDPDASHQALVARAELAAASGCGGIVCAASDLAVVAAAAPGLVRVVPGIRPRGAARDDQARAATPAEAAAAGADLLVVGRAVTAAADPEAAAAALVGELAAAP